MRAATSRRGLPPASVPGRFAASLLLAASALLLPATLRATVPIVDSDDVQFSLAGYVRGLTGYQRQGYDVPEGFPSGIGTGSSVVRFEWGLNLGEHVTVDLHNRFFWRLVNEDVPLTGDLLGVGVSQPPGRSVDLESTIIDEGGLLFTHDVDRLALRLFMDWGDVTVGRQAITWGHGTLFPVADLWTTFSPFELDTSEKRGIDAVRVITAPGERWELELIVADKGTVEDLSGGARAMLYLEAADVYVAFAKLWEELLLFVGVQADLEQYSLRAELVAPWDLDDGEAQLPRATLGWDYIAPDWLVSLELHFNGLGTGNVPGGYLGELGAEELGRGETYLLGRYYLGGLVSYELTELVRFNATVITNLTDPSVIVSATASYDVAANADIIVGAYVPVGSSPDFVPVPAVNSEFGSYAQFYFAQVSAYW